MGHGRLSRATAAGTDGTREVRGLVLVARVNDEVFLPEGVLEGVVKPQNIVVECQHAAVRAKLEILLAPPIFGLERAANQAKSCGLA